MPFRVIILLVTFSSALYGAAFIPLSNALGPGVAALSALPVVVTGWALGLRMGIIGGILAFPLNTLLLNLTGDGGWDVVIQGGGGPGSLAIVLIGATVGRMHDLSQQAKNELEERLRAEGESARLVAELQDALAKIKNLDGLLPICASCKKIRDDEGHWSHIETYIQDRSEAEFTHSICPDCTRTLYPGRMTSTANS